MRSQHPTSLPSEERILQSTMGTQESQFNTHPQPRTFAPSKEDVLQNLQYFFASCRRSNRSHAHQPTHTLSPIAPF